MSVITPLDSPACADPPLRVGPFRFGLTVSKRQARRAVARNTVRRVLRESARLRAPALEAALEAALAAASLPGKGLDVLFRLKAPLPDAATTGWSAVKAQLRREADSLLDQLLGVLQSGNALAVMVQVPRQAPHQSLAQSAHGRNRAGAPEPGARPASRPAGTPK